MEWIIKTVLVLLVISGLFTVLSKNPVHSVFYLILAFVASTFLLLMLHVEFIAMLFLVVYIGAISVLFLFVVMMLNIKVVELNEKIIQYLPIGVFIIIIFFLEIIYMINSSLFIINEDFLYMLWDVNKPLIFSNLTFNNYFQLLDTFVNISAISQILYTKYIYLFIISGMILLVAMIGAILLTLNQSFKSKRQDLFLQINRRLPDAITFIQ